MPSLQDIRDFNDSFVRLANEPDVIREWGEDVEALPEPDEGLDTDLSSLLEDTGSIAGSGESGDLSELPTNGGPEESEPDFARVLEDAASGEVVESVADAVVEEDQLGEATPEEVDFSDFEALLGGDSLTETAEPELDDPPGDALQGEAFDDDFSDAEKPFGEELLTEEISADQPPTVDEVFGDDAIPDPPTEDDPLGDDSGGFELSEEEISFDDETFSLGDESAAEPAGRDELFGAPEGGEEIGTGEEGEFAGIDSDFGAFDFTDEEAETESPRISDESPSFEEPTVPGVSAVGAIEGDSGEQDDDDLGVTEVDEFSLGDFGAELGVLGEEGPPTDEDLNPALSVSKVTAGAPRPPGGEFQISDREFQSLQTTLSGLPLNLKREVEGIVTESKGPTAEIEKLVNALATGESAAEVAALAGRILGTQIRIPRGYEKRTGLEFEAERGSFAYQFRENVLPILRLVAIVVIAIGTLALAGYNLVYRPLYGRSLYREGITQIRDGQHTLGNQTFERARDVWPSSRWFYTYAEAFASMRQYTLAGEKYEQLLFGMSVAERDLNNDRLERGLYSAIVADRAPEKQGILDYAGLQSDVLGNFARADRILRLILTQDVADYDGRLAAGDNFMRWAESDPSKYEEARVAYVRLMERYGQTDELLFRMLRYFVRTENLEEVVTLKELFQQDGRASIEPSIYAEMAGYLIENSRLEDIEAVLFRALDTDPLIPEIHYNLARYYRLITAKGEEELALSTADRLLTAANPITSKLRGMHVDTITRMGENLYGAERFVEAQEKFAQAIDLYEEGVRRRVLSPERKYGRAYAHLADILYYVGRQYDDALRYLQDAEKNGYDDADLDYKQGFILYRNGQLESALLEFREAADDPSAPTNALLWATGNTYFRRGNFFAAEAYYRELLDQVGLQRDRIRNLLVDEDPQHQSVVQYLIRVNNNLGVTLNRLSDRTGDPDLYATALIHLTESIEHSENFSRDPLTLARSDAVDLPYLNQRGILYPTPEYSLQIYNNLPEDLDDPLF